MNLLVTAPELWQTIWSGLGDFWSNEYTQMVFGYLDTTIFGIAIVVFYKYIGPKIMENERLKKEIQEKDKMFEDFLGKIDERMDRVFGLNVGFKADFIALKEAFNVAFSNSNLTVAAKTLIKTILEGVISGKPIDISDELEQLGDVGRAAVNEVREKAEAIAADNKEVALSALEQLALEAEASNLPDPETPKEG